MKVQKLLHLLITCTSISSITLLYSAADLDNDEQRKLITFKATAQYLCDENDIKTEDYLAKLGEGGYNWNKTDYGYHHPLIEKGKRPYRSDYGNGGLLNPVLESYESTKETVKTENQIGLKFTVQGSVSADGLDQYNFDNTYLGNTNRPEYKDCYEMSTLEAVILAYLKERCVDRQLSDLTPHFFEGYGEKEFADAWTECVQREWNSKLSDDDSGQRTAEDTLLIKRHLARNCYWQSQFQNPKDQRMGKVITGFNAAPGAYPPESLHISMPEFEISVHEGFSKTE